MNRKKKVIRSEGREMIAKVFHFLRQEYQFMKMHNYDNCDLSPLANITRRTAEATGVGEKLVSTILKEERNLPSPSARFPSPDTSKKPKDPLKLKNTGQPKNTAQQKNKKPKKDKKTDLNDPSLEYVRDAIEDYHKKHKEIPTLEKLKEVLQEDDDDEEMFEEITIKNNDTESPGMFEEITITPNIKEETPEEGAIPIKVEEILP